MKLKRTYNSISGVVIISFSLAILGIMFLRSGSKAFSPGELSEVGGGGVVIRGFDSHFEFEKECSLCHKPLETTQDELCIECHSNLIEQINLSIGVHGHIEQVERCARCHTDHQGRDFDMTYDADRLFDHSVTQFSLIRHQIGYDTKAVGCSACHDTQDQFWFSLERCEACHLKQDAGFIQEHNFEFGRECVDCHDGIDLMTQFDHQAAGFPLEGKHAQVSCADCHEPFFKTQILKKTPEDRMTSFKNAPEDCHGCHLDPQVHRNLFTLDCAACHGFLNWSPAILFGSEFEHSANTGFSLVLHSRDYENQPLKCIDCHTSDWGNFDTQVCIGCHSTFEEQAVFISEHMEKYGSLCRDCHDGVDRMVGFNHATYFPLEGRHAAISCGDCHINKTFSGTPADCVECHAEPVIHAGFFGLECQNCHNTRAWFPAQMSLHTFPLEHGEMGELECQICHPQRYTQYTCFGCHEHQPELTAAVHLEERISEPELFACAQCHPSGLENE